MPKKPKHRKPKLPLQDKNNDLPQKRDQENSIDTDIDTESINTESGNIICRDLKLTLSDERLKGIMSHLYETAYDNACKPGVLNHCDVWFSLAVTILIAIITAEFKDFPAISGNTLSNIFCGGFAVCVLMVIISLAAKDYRHHNNVNSNRDTAVEHALQEIIKAGEKKSLTDLNNDNHYSV